jgi:hypothetical protein
MAFPIFRRRDLGLMALEKGVDEIKLKDQQNISAV